MLRLLKVLVLFYVPESPLPLPSLRLFIPPLRLVSAAMWQVIQRGQVQDYGMVEEFITTVSEVIPDLLNVDQKAELLLGLRARVSLEPHVVQVHLERIRALVSTWAPCFAEVEFPESNFVYQVKSLMKDPEEKKRFFQDVFPTDFGSEYDSALQMLMLDFLSRLEKLLPVPDIQQTATLLSAVPSALDECVHSVPDPRHLKTVLQYHAMLGHFDLLGDVENVTYESQTIPSSFGNCILSSLSLPQLEKVEIDADQIELQPSTEQIEGCMTVQVEGETVTLLDYIQIEQPPGVIGPDVETEVNPQGTVEEDGGDALKPAAFQPLKQSKRLQLKRMLSDEDKDSAAKRQRKKYPNNKICPVCNKIFLRAAAMRRHLETHSANRELKYKCANCDNRTLPYSADIAKHLRSHTEERPYICVTCEKGFKYRDTLKKHQIIHGHEGIREEQSKTVEQILAEADAQNCGDGGAKENEPRPPADTPAHVASVPVRKVHQKAAKVCPVCARTFDSVKTLNRHIQCHTEDRPFHCIHCKKRFKHMHGLKRHQIYAICHKKIARFSWKREQRAASSQSEATAADVQPALKIPVWCSNCGKHFEYPSALKEHQENVCKVELSEVMKCDDCGKVFKSMTLLKRHKLMHRPMQCTMCDKTFTLLRRLREHYEKQHDFTGPYPCAQCSKTFMQLSYLAIHQRIHKGEFPYMCHLCPEKFRSSNCLNVHLRKHTGEKPFLCWQCGKCYRSASELTVHMGTHSEEKPWACGQCDVAYRTKLQLTNHVEQVHIGVRYPCNTCGKQFMKETSLKRHELIHTGERPHQCTVCGKTFLTANELKLHNRYHTGERPYKCEECGKAFIQSGYLKSHMRIHTGEKPFKCDICDKGFRLSYHMKKHRRTHSSNSKTYSCKECGMAFLVKKLLWEHSLTHNMKVEQQFTDEVQIEFQ
uniref:C2H2-type domain-containing protein n=1 Tax=Takifugu rubripes TaxID=31033 RepID=H2UHX0_TAKRU